MNRLLAILLTAAALVTASPAQARDCSAGFAHFGQGRLEMPPPKYWSKPSGHYTVLDCATIQALSQKGSDADCHLLGGHIEAASTGAALMGFKRGDVYVCKGLSGAALTMVLIHEFAHRQGWEHGSGGSRQYTTAQWVASKDVPAWAKRGGIAR